MSESQNQHNDALDDKTTIVAVCDNCSTGYRVSVLNFKDSYKHEFHCEHCNESWVEYLDTPVWEQVREIVLELDRIEQEKLAAAREKQERERLAIEEAAKAAAMKKAAEAAALAEAEALATEEPLAEAENLEGAESTPFDEATSEDTDTALDSEAKLRKIQRAPIKKESAENDTPQPQSAKKILVFLNPVAWGNFSVAPLAVSLIMFLLVIVSSGSFFYMRRAEIVRDNPLTQASYNLFGIHVSPVDNFGVKIDKLERKNLMIPGETTTVEYNLHARVTNYSDEEHRAPYIRFSALDIEGKSLSVWDINLTKRVLQSGEEMHVITKIPDSFIQNERIETFVLRLISKQERELLDDSPILTTVSIS